MNSAVDDALTTPRLQLRLQSTESMLAQLDALSPEDRAQVSPEWLAQLRSQPPSLWTHGFALVLRETGAVVGTAAYKGPPADGTVEIAYAIDAPHRGRGYAKEAAQALVRYAAGEGVAIVLAHTLPEASASTSVLTASGFTKLGEVMDPEDGRVWRWQLRHA